MSNNAFHHSDPKVTDAMIIIVGILHRRGAMTGHNRLKECVKKIRQDIYDVPLKRLGKTPETQREIIEQALTLLTNRGLAAFNRRTKSLSITKRGEHEREHLIQARRQPAIA